MEYFVFVSMFQSMRLSSRKNWTMPTLDAFIESLYGEQDKLISMEKFKDPRHMLLVCMMEVITQIRDLNPNKKEMHTQIKRRKGTPNP